jgi:hypothetical protein
LDVLILSDLPTTFIGVELPRTERAIRVVMKQYIHKLDFLATDATLEEYASIRACLLWLSHARPDVAAFACLCASNKKQDVDETAVSAMNQTLARLKETADLALSFPAIDVDTLPMVVYADSSFANGRNKRSQVGHVLCLRDKTGTMCILGYRRCNYWRVIRPVMAAETLAFTAAFDNAFSVRDQVKKVLKGNVPITIYTDSKALYDILTSNRTTAEARLMIDLAATRQSCNRLEMQSVGLIRSEFNLAHALTKQEPNDALYKALKTGKISHPVEEFIIR